MSAVRKPSIADRYRWLLDLLEAEFPGKIKVSVDDFGSKLRVAYHNGKKLAVYAPEYYWTDPKTGKATLRSLNASSNKGAATKKIVAAFRKVAHA